VRLFVVAVNARVGSAGENFVVAGIGELPAIGHRDHATLILVAEELTVPGDFIPKKRQQVTSPLPGGVTPELGAQGICVLAAAIVLGHQDFFGAVEYLLPPQPVADDEEDVLGFESGGPRFSHQGQACECENNGEAAAETERGCATRSVPVRVDAWNFPRL